MVQRYFFNFFISDSITLCSFQWKRRCCRDSAAEWSQHQSKRCKLYLIDRKSSIVWEREMKWHIYIPFVIQSIYLQIEQCACFIFSLFLPCFSLSSSCLTTRSLQTSFPMDAWCLFVKSCGQGLESVGMTSSVTDWDDVQPQSTRKWEMVMGCGGGVPLCLHT